MKFIIAALLLLQAPNPAIKLYQQQQATAKEVSISLERKDSTVLVTVDMTPNDRNIWLCVRVLDHGQKDFEMAHCGFVDDLTQLQDEWPNMKGSYQFRAVLQRHDGGADVKTAAESFTSNLVEIDVP